MYAVSIPNVLCFLITCNISCSHQFQHILDVSYKPLYCIVLPLPLLPFSVRLTVGRPWGRQICAPAQGRRFAQNSVPVRLLGSASVWLIWLRVFLWYCSHIFLDTLGSNRGRLIRVQKFESKGTNITWVRVSRYRRVTKDRGHTITARPSQARNVSAFTVNLMHSKIDGLFQLLLTLRCVKRVSLVMECSMSYFGAQISYSKIFLT